VLGKPLLFNLLNV